MGSDSDIRSIAFLGDYVPRQCGIATFTKDLRDAVATTFRSTRCLVVPVTDLEDGYDYPEEVCCEIAEQELSSYRHAADFLNIRNVDVVSVQHEFGIFGGPAGSHVLTTLRTLRTPVVTTLHTVLEEPTPEQRRVMDEIAARSTRLVVMSRRGQELLRQVYEVPEEKVTLIPHGIPDMPFVDPSFFKDELGVDGRFVLLTFGLLSPNKGIESVLEALPAIVEAVPNLVYIILGATHPRLVRERGETYRFSLERMTQKLGIRKNVMFCNRFLELDELKKFIGAADIYITPYLNQAQVTSGTLAYVFGAGKAVISTPYWHAQELLAEDRGVLVPFGQPEAIAREVLSLVKDEGRRNALRRNAYRLGREMVWSNVARLYVRAYEQARQEHARSKKGRFAIATLDQQPRHWPEIKLDHLLRMTDSTGILQHAMYSVPNFAEGYCTDDNSRALIFTVMLEELGLESKRVRALATTYLAFIAHAFDRDRQRFRNFMGFDRRWLDAECSEDSNGRALWALGYCAGRSRRPSFQELAARLFGEALPCAANFKFPRAWAFTLLGLEEYLGRLSGDRRGNEMRDVLAGRLWEVFRTGRSENWPWCEPILTYDNAKLGQALIRSGQTLGQDEMVETGLRALRWLVDLQTSKEGHFRPIGCNGFYPRGGPRARFDQQPIEAQSTLSGCLEAYRCTGDDSWMERACRVFDWFLGGNDLGLELYSANTAGCYDALHVDRINRNQGAESLLAFLLSRAELELTDDRELAGRSTVPREVVPNLAYGGQP